MRSDVFAILITGSKIGHSFSTMLGSYCFILYFWCFCGRVFNTAINDLLNWLSNSHVFSFLLLSPVCNGGKSDISFSYSSYLL